MSEMLLGLFLGSMMSNLSRSHAIPMVKCCGRGWRVTRFALKLIIWVSITIGQEGKTSPLQITEFQQWFKLSNHFITT